MKAILKASVLGSSICVATLLTGCGGGGSSASAVIASPATVSSVTAEQMMYGKLARFTVAGQNLDSGISMTAPACSGIAKVAGGTAAQQVFTCTPSATGAIQVTVAASSGGSQAAINPSVPQPQVTMNILLGTTALGTIIVELNPTAAPITANNFLQYVNGGSYNNAIFHRIAGFVIQGGGYDQSLTAIPAKAPIALEVNKGLSNVRGTIAMARNNVLDSATSQFFINMQNNAALDTSAGGYAVFGKVVSGMTVADQINAVPTIANLAPFDTLPAPKAVVISSATQTQ